MSGNITYGVMTLRKRKKKERQEQKKVATRLAKEIAEKVRTDEERYLLAVAELRAELIRESDERYFEKLRRDTNQDIVPLDRDEDISSEP